VENPSVAVVQNRDWFPTALWLTRHEDHLKRKTEGRIDLLFLGDSITEGWRDTGVATWEKYYAPRNAANFGIGGDETQHVLWRIENGEVEGLNPKVVVLLIGTNNLGNSGFGGDDTAKGIVCIVRLLRKKLPATRILLLGVFPRDFQPGTHFRKEIDKINQTIAKLDDGDHVRFLDIALSFLQRDGSISPEIMPDALHISSAAYGKWAEAMEPLLKEMLNHVAKR